MSQFSSTIFDQINVNMQEDHKTSELTLENLFFVEAKKLNNEVMKF